MWFALAVAACGFLDDSENNPELTLTVSGLVSGPAPPAEALVVAVWDSSGEQANYWKWGEGQAAGGSFSITFDGPPPDEAHFAADLDAAVGWLVMYESGTEVPDGAWSTPAGGFYGASRRNLLAWKAQKTTEPLDWFDPLPMGWSCLECIAGVDGGDTGGVTIYDTLQTSSCGLITLYLSDDPDAPDWCNAF